MEAVSHRQRLILPIAPIAALIAAVFAAAAVLAIPVAVLEDMVVDSGIASLITAAAPPLGMTARLAIAFLAAATMGGLLWTGLTLLLGNRGAKSVRRSVTEGVPVLRRADAHPDCPPRQPVFANRDLGTPFLDIRADAVTGERPLPVDLDTPLSAYLHPLDAPLPPPAEPESEPAKIERPASVELEATPLPIRLDVEEAVESKPIVIEAWEPAAPPIAPAVEQLPAQPEPRFAPNERIETFDLTPVPRPSEEIAAPMPGPSGGSGNASIHDLLDRLERGVSRRSPAPDPVSPPVQPVPVSAAAAAVSEESIEHTLDVLRRLAARAG